VSPKIVLYALLLGCELVVSVGLSRCPFLRGPKLSHPSDLVFTCSSAFYHLVEFFVRFLLFHFKSELVTMCVVNALINWKIEDHEHLRTGGWSLLSDE
jgi:hypothetical protein